MSKTILWTLCVVLAAGLNKLAQWGDWRIDGVLMHVPPTAFLGAVVIGYTYLRNITTGPVTTKSKVASWILGAVTLAGSVAVYLVPVPPTPAEVQDVPAAIQPASPVDAAPVPAGIGEAAGVPVTTSVPNVSTGTPGASGVETAPQAEALTPVLEVVQPIAAPEVETMGLLFCLIPAFSWRRFRLALVGLAGLAIVGCCGAQTEADALWLNDTTCWEYVQLTAGTKTDPLGKAFLPEQVERRVKLLQERMARKGMTCEGTTF